MKIDAAANLDRLCRTLAARANSGTWNGRDITRYFAACRGAVAITPETWVRAIYTRDTGHHASGWWKNPDYERCRHLSLSFYAVVGGLADPLPRDVPTTRAVLDRLFGVQTRRLWCEPPYSPQGKASAVWHYRLFCDPAWEPITPRAEVYSKDLTEAGWLSFSDVRAGLTAEAERAAEVIGNLVADLRPTGA